MHAVQDPLRGATVIHVADLEGDALELLADLLLHQMSFVIRAKNDRGLVAGREATDLKLFAAVTATPVVITTTVEFRRNQRTKKSDAPPLVKQAESRAGTFQGDHLGGDPRSVT